MGISGLIPFVNAATKASEIRDFKGKSSDFEDIPGNSEFAF